MNLLTLNDVFPIARRFVDSGAACDFDTIVDAIHEANQRLLVKADWPHTVMLTRAKVSKDCFPIPREMAAIRAINIENRPSTVESAYFQFMSAGPGEAKSWWNGIDPSIEEVGWFPTMYDIPSIESPDGCNVADSTFNSEGLQIMAFTTSPADLTKKIKIRGRGKLNTPLSSSDTEFLPDEEIGINAWAGAEGTLQGDLTTKRMSVGLYRDITSWTKLATAGHISLYAVEPSTSRMWFLAKAHPNDLAPTWRRYRVRNQDCCRGSNILILGKIAAEKPTSLTDIMPIQNLAAMKHMIMAISAENSSNMKGAQEHEATAMRLLAEQKSDTDSQGPTVQVIDHDVAISNARTNRYISR